MANKGKHATRIAIRTQVIELIKEKPIGEINVTEITTALGIHRTTFYNYYESVYDVVEEIESEFFAGYTPGIRASDLTEHLKFLQENKEPYLVLIDYLHHEPMFRLRVLKAIKTTTLNELDQTGIQANSSTIDAYYSYDYGGAASLILWWLKNGQDIPAEDFAESLISLSNMTREYFFKKVPDRFSVNTENAEPTYPVYVI